MKNINSSYIAKYIFSILNDKIQLKLILYNKQLQNNFDINITNYKIFSGKYKIIDKNGKGKEFNIFNDEIIFEGEYKNKKKNGKGKEYDDEGNLIFEGEYLNGKRHGIGKEYHKNGNMKFHGEYKEGKFWNGKVYNYSETLISEFKNGKGYIEEYNTYGELSFSCEYLNGEKNGIGETYFYDENFSYGFSLDYLNGKKWKGKRSLNIAETKRIRFNNFSGQFVYELNEGKGYMSYYDYRGHLIYTENYLNGEKNGKIIQMSEFNDVAFEGEFLNNKLNGKVKKYYDNGQIKFEGEYLYGHKRKGIKYFKNGKIKFEGEYLFDREWDGIRYDKEGNILYKLSQGKGKIEEYTNLPSLGKILTFKGEYINGKRNGKGKEYNYKYNYSSCEYDIINIFEGNYINGKRNGKGKEYENKTLLFEGEYLEGIKHGKGKEYYNNGKIKFEGNYLSGEKDGFGKEYYENGKLLFEGEFKGSKQWTGKGYDPEENKIAYEIKDGNGYMKKYDSDSGKIYEEGNYLNGEIVDSAKEYEEEEELKQENQIIIINEIEEPKEEDQNKINFTHPMINYSSPESIKEIETCPPEKLFLIISKRINSIDNKLTEILKNHKRYNLICLYYKIYSNFLQNSYLGINPKIIFQQKDPNSLLKISDFDFYEVLVNNLNCQITRDELYLILRSLKQKTESLYSYDEFLKNVYNIQSREVELKNIYKECRFYFDDYIYSFRHFIQDNKIDYKSAFSRTCTDKTTLQYDLFKKFLAEIGFKFGDEKEFIHLFCALCESNYTPFWNNLTCEASITLNKNQNALISQKTLFEVAERKDISEKDFCKEGLLFNKKKDNEWTKNIINFTEETKKLQIKQYESFKNDFQKIHKKCFEYKNSDLTEIFEESDYDITPEGDIEFRDFKDAIMNIGVSYSVELDILINRFKSEKKSQKEMIKLVEFLSIYNLFKDEFEKKESGKESDNKEYIYKNARRKFTQDDIDYISEVCLGLAEIIIDELHDSVTNFFNKKDKNKKGYISFDDLKDILYYDLKVDYKSDIDNFQVFFDFVLSDKLVEGEEIIETKNIIYIIIFYSKRDKPDNFENNEEEDNNELKNNDFNTNNKKNILFKEEEDLVNKNITNVKLEQKETEKEKNLNKNVDN